MERWLIELDDAQRACLQQDHLSLGTLIEGQAGRHYLVFRDSFVALKVASCLGLKRNPARALPAAAANGYTPLAHLSNGHILIADL